MAGSFTDHVDGTGRIDVHTHAIDPGLSDRLAGYSGSFPSVRRTRADRAEVLLDGAVYREIDERCWSPAARLRDMDAEGIAMQVVSPMPITLCHDQPAEGARVLAAAQNALLADLVAAAPDRFRAFGCVPLQDPEGAVEELRRCVEELGFVGVEIGTRVGDDELADPRFEPFFSAAADLGTVVFVHPVDRTLDPRLARLGIGFGMGMPTETATAAAGLLVGGLPARLPGLRILLAHGGGSLPAVLPRVSLGQQVVGGVADPDELASAGARAMWCDSLTYDVDALALAAHRFTADHVVLGTDYPFTAREVPAGAVLDRAADRLPVERIGRDNALELLTRVPHSVSVQPH